MIVETMEDLYINYIRRFRKVGIVVGNTNSQNMVKKIIKILKNTEIEGYI